MIFWLILIASYCFLSIRYSDKDDVSHIKTLIRFIDRFLEALVQFAAVQSLRVTLRSWSDSLMSSVIENVEELSSVKPTAQIVEEITSSAIQEAETAISALLDDRHTELSRIKAAAEATAAIECRQLKEDVAKEIVRYRENSGLPSLNSDTFTLDRLRQLWSWSPVEAQPDIYGCVINELIEHVLSRTHQMKMNISGTSHEVNELLWRLCAPSIDKVYKKMEISTRLPSLINVLHGNCDFSDLLISANLAEILGMVEVSHAIHEDISINLDNLDEQLKVPAFISLLNYEKFHAQPLQIPLSKLSTEALSCMKMKKFMDVFGGKTYSSQDDVNALIRFKRSRKIRDDKLHEH